MSLTTATELWRMSAKELAEAIRTKQVSTRDVIEAHLRRIEAVNPSINAVVILMAEQALKAAKAADRAVAAGAELEGRCGHRGPRWHHHSDRSQMAAVREERS